MQRIDKSHWITLSGILAGALAGYAWFFFVGCQSGTCPITSNPWTSTLYGSVMGGLAFTSLAHKDDEKKHKPIK
jgi:hypothetical protein